METKPLAIIIGRNYSTRLCLIQSMGEAGCDVVVIQTSKYQKKIETIDASSRFVVGVKMCKEPNREGLIEIINSYKDSSRRILLIPADDYAASVIDQNLDCLQDYFICPHVNKTQGSVIQLMDKEFQKSLAKRVGLNVAKSWIAYYVDGEYVIPSDVTYPCFTKPLECYSNGPLKRFLKKCDSEKDLRNLLKRISRLYQVPILIEQYHKIDKEYAVLGLSLCSQSIIPSVIQMLSNKDGLTATGTIFPISRIPNLQQKLTNLMSETQLVGLFDIDLYESEGELYFNELNVRYGASGFALNKVVGNLPRVYIDYQLGRNVDMKQIRNVFEERSFASEKVLAELYLNKKISYSQYKKTLANSEVLSLDDQYDVNPYIVYHKKERMIVVKRNYLGIKKEVKKRFLTK